MSEQFRAWHKRAGVQSRQVHEHLVEQPRDLREVQCDELRVKMQRGVVWVASGHLDTDETLFRWRSLSKSGSFFDNPIDSESPIVSFTKAIVDSH